MVNMLLPSIGPSLGLTNLIPSAAYASLSLPSLPSLIWHTKELSWQQWTTSKQLYRTVSVNADYTIIFRNVSVCALRGQNDSND